MSDLRPLWVPTVHRDAFIELGGLAVDDAERVLGAIEALPPFLTAVDLVEQVAARAELSSQDAGDLVRAGLGLHSQTRYHGWTATVVADAVAASPELEIPAERRDEAAGRFRRLLEAAAISSTARAADLQTEHERVFHDARVVTDLRPIFGEDVHDRPAGVVVNEMLKLEYFQKGEIEEFFVALDRNDLARLKQVIDRAVAKTETLTSFLQDSGINHFELEGRHDS